MPARLIVLLLFLLLFMVVPSAIALLTEWFWFTEVDYTGIFVRTLTTKASVGGMVFCRLISGELRALCDLGAEVSGYTQGLQVGAKVSLTLMFSCQYSIEFLCEVCHIDPGMGYCVAFKPKCKRCLALRPLVPGQCSESRCAWPPRRRISQGRGDGR